MPDSHTVSDSQAQHFPCRSELLFSYRATLLPPEVIGPVTGGIRVNWYITGGEFNGPRLRGQVKPVGADFFLIRPDGIGELDVRALFETHDGALIDVSYPGIGDLGPDGHAAFLRGEVPQRLSLKTTPRTRTAHPDYQWLERLLCVGLGEIDMATLTVRYDVYSLS